MAVGYKHPRGTKANLDTLAGSSGLSVGQLYHITDQGGRTAIGTAINTYVFTQTRGLSIFVSGKPPATKVVGGGVAPYAFILSAANSTAKAQVAFASSAVFTIKNGATTIGTITFAASDTTGTINFSGSTTVAAGDVITLTSPAQDATGETLTIMLKE